LGLSSTALAACLAGFELTSFLKNKQNINSLHKNNQEHTYLLVPGVATPLIISIYACSLKLGAELGNLSPAPSQAGQKARKSKQNTNSLW
jgi:hypothetical protein